MRRHLLIAVLVGCFTALLAPSARAMSLYWDTDGSSVNGIQAGSGTWDTGTTATWSSATAGSSPLLLWTIGGDDARFYTNSTPSSLVTVGVGGVSANSVQFTGTGYTLSGGTLTLGAGGIVTNASGIINAPIAGTSGLTVSGTGSVLLGGANTYSGTTTISSGTLRVSGVPVGSGGYYSFDSVSGTTVNNTGSLGAAYNGTFTNSAVVTSGGGGARGEGMSLPASGSEMLINLVGGRGIDLAGGNWTASGWYYNLAPTGAWRTLFRGNVNDHQVIVDTTAGSQLLGSYDGAGGGNFRSTGYSMAPVATGWHQVTAVGTGTTTSMYMMAPWSAPPTARASRISTPWATTRAAASGLRTRLTRSTSTSGR